jgi:plastocyanin
MHTIAAIRCFCRFVPWLAISIGLPASAANFEVSVGEHAPIFAPKILNIQVGDSVTFVHKAGHRANVVASGLFRCAQGCDGEGGNGNPSELPWTVTRIFTEAGTVNYHCDEGIATGMRGQIVVSPAATTTIGPGFTGAWYDPQQSGHGILVEVLPSNQLFAYWYTFTPDGTQQAWFGGVGPITGNTATVPVHLTTGGRWIPNFDQTKIVNNAWGTLTFTFSDCDTGRVDFTSTLPGYGSHHMNLKRLTQPAGLTCP